MVWKGLDGLLPTKKFSCGGDGYSLGWRGHGDGNGS